MIALTAIPTNFGSAGSGITPNGSGGSPSLATLLENHRAAIDELQQGLTADLSDSDPEDVGGGSSKDSGVSTEAARIDHVHALVAATTTVPGSMSAVDKVILDHETQAAGTALTDAATQTMLVSAGFWRTIATLGQAGELTLSNTGAVARDIVTITRTSTDAWAYVIKNGAGVTLTTLPASKQSSATFQFSGTAWVLKTVGQLA